jgi:hypothetical protein
MAIQGAEAISEEVFEAKAPYLIPAEGNQATTLGCIGQIVRGCDFRSLHPACGITPSIDP